MANKTRKLQNPFLVLFAKTLLNYEFSDSALCLTDTDLAAKIYDRYKSEKYANTVYNIKNKTLDPIAYNKAYKLYDQILRVKHFNFSDSQLDKLVTELTSLYKFSNWKDFTEQFKEHPACIDSEGYISETLSPEIFFIVQALANKVLLAIDAQKQRIGNMVSDDFGFCNPKYIRTIQEKEIMEIERLAKRIYPCSINDFSIKKPWHRKNPNIFYVYNAGLGLWANINLLPLKEDCFNKLKNGFIYENQITADDIYLIEEKDQVKHIYIEGLACVYKRLLPLFRDKFPDMIASLADINRKDLKISAFGGSKEGDLFIENHDFKKTKTVKDPVLGISYGFYEINWLELNERLKNTKHISSSLSSSKRLTKINLTK